MGPAVKLEDFLDEPSTVNFLCLGFGRGDSIEAIKTKKTRTCNKMRDNNYAPDSRDQATRACENRPGTRCGGFSTGRPPHPLSLHGLFCLFGPFWLVNQHRLRCSRHEACPARPSTECVLVLARWYYPRRFNCTKSPDLMGHGSTSPSVWPPSPSAICHLERARLRSNSAIRLA